jgi:glucosamine-6-phosphate deaminase
MQILHSDSRAEFDRRAADCVQHVLAARPDAVLALPTGRTPLGLYAELLHRQAAGSIEFGRASFFQLDEYVGVASDDARSFAASLQACFLSRVVPGAQRVHRLRGDGPDLEKECRRYDAQLAACGGLDLAILGLGANGHIAFNEPGSSWNSRTHVVALAPQTRSALPEGFQPSQGITMGIETIRAARRILLLVSGPAKRPALEALQRGLADVHWPVTALLGHPQLTIILSEEFDVAENS